MSSIFVLGSFVVDLMCRAPHLPLPGETVFAGPFRLGPGGKGSNQAIAAARAGAAVGFMTRVGEDDFAALARRTLQAEGIADTFVYATPEHATGAALIMVDENTAENAITVAVGACAQLTAADVAAAEAEIAASRIFLTQLETSLEATFAGLALARKHGVLTILNPAPVQPVTPAQLAGIDILTPNETEAAALTGLPVTTPAEAEAAARQLLGWGVKNVLLTMGAQGVLVVNEGGATLVPAFAVDEVVDTTGAGDAFNGGLAAALAEGRPLLEAVRFGCAVAGLSVTQLGTAPAMPHRNEVEALLARAAAA